MSKSIKIAVSIIFCGIFSVAGAKEEKCLNGKVIYSDSSPAAGTVIYALGGRAGLHINNNLAMAAENIPRAITDLNGNFQIKGKIASEPMLFAKDMEDNCVLVFPQTDNESFAEIIMPESATIKGTLLKGDELIKNKTITAYYKSPHWSLRYSASCRTNGKGQFRFRSLMPGDYQIQVIHEVPQVGCSFVSVITKQADVTVGPGGEYEIKLGGTDLPFLKGKITDTEGNGLHGVWVRLEEMSQAEPQNKQGCFVSTDWSEVTERDGSYQIFDIPPGQYNLHCFRRLALNNYGRTLQADKVVTIKEDTPKPQSEKARAENNCDIEIDLQPFMPLEYDQESPPLTGTLLTGEKFDLSEHKGKIVVLHFYAGWCSASDSMMAQFDELAETIGSEKLLVLGVSLDKSSA